MTHPHDFSLLNDLLDGRMGWSAAEELRRRLVEEPELGQAYDELVRLRAGLQALPRRVPPADFLAGVRARAGLPPSVAAVAASPSAPAGGGSDPTGARGSKGSGGNVLRLRRRFLPWAAAAGLLAGLGGFALWRVRDRVEVTSIQQSAESRTREGTLGGREKEVARGAARGAAAAGPIAPTEPPSEGATGLVAPHFGAPGGAVPPGLRTPSDDPGASSPAGPLVKKEDAKPGVAPAPEAGLLPDATTSAANVPGSRASPSGAPTGGTPPESGEAPAPGVRREAGMGDASATGGGGAGSGRAAELPDRAAGAKVRARASGLAWARTGADDVLVLRASGYDAARADVALLLAAVRSGAAVGGRLKDAQHLPGARDGTRTMDTSSEEDAHADGDEVAGPGSPAAPDLASSEGEEGKRKAAAPGSVPALGTFVIEVTEGEWTRLSTAFEPVPEAEPQAAGPAPAAEAPKVLPPSPAPPAPPSSPAPVPSTPAGPPPPPGAPPPTPGAPPPVGPSSGPESPPVPEPAPAAPPAVAPPPMPTVGPPASEAPPPADAEALEAAKAGAPAKLADKLDAPSAGPSTEAAPRRRVRIVILQR